MARSLSALRGRCWSTAARFVVHFLNKHEGGIRFLIDAHEALRLFDEESIGLGEAIRGQDSRLVDELIPGVAEFDRRPGGPDTVGLIARSIGDERFRTLWNALWNDRVWKNCPRIAGRALLAGASNPSRAHLVVELLRKSSSALFEVLPDEVVRTLVAFSGLEDFRDEALDMLLKLYGAKAARVILCQSELFGKIPACVSGATRILLNEDAQDPYVPVGLGLWLAIDAPSARPVIARWLATAAPAFVSTAYLEYRAQTSEQGPLFEQLAQAAIGQPEYMQPLFASRHHRLITDLSVVVAWLENNVGRDEASKYCAATVVRYLSDLSSGSQSDVVKRLRDIAANLHNRSGSLTKDEIIRRANLTDSNIPGHATLVAIALARDVLSPAPKFEKDIVLRNLRSYGSTYRALGGDALKKAVSKGKVPWCAGLYADDLTRLRQGEATRIMKGELSSTLFERHEQFWRSIEGQRELWERRFRRIEEARIAFTPRQSEKLRLDPYSWVEIRILERLLPFFKVEPEPTGLRGIEDKVPDFLLRSDDGTLILEVAAVGIKPDDVREATKIGRGGLSKKTLLNKWREQFKECTGDIEYPVVIALQPQWAFDLDFDLPNSLYGPEQWSITLHLPTHEKVAEAVTRDTEKAFYTINGTHCISAVAGISPVESEPFEGELFRPLQKVHNPIPYSLWVRLRTALFGPRPKSLVDRLLQIPTITQHEAEILVDSGVDDLSFFAEGLLPYSDGMPVSKERFEGLVGEAIYLRNVQNSGRIVHLKAAQGVDLTPLYQGGLHFIRQLIKATQPQGIPTENWAALISEARQVLGEESRPVS